MNRLIPFIPSFFALVLHAQNGEGEADLVSPPRTWKSVSGSAIDGVLLFFDDKRVVIKPEGRDPLSLQPEQLSLEDRTYLEQWEQEKMTFWEHDTSGGGDQRMTGSAIIIPKYDRPLRVDSDGNLKEPFVVLVEILEKNPNILRRLQDSNLNQMVEAHTEDGGTRSFASLGIPLRGTKGEVSLIPVKMGFPLTNGKTFIYLRVSGSGKTFSNSITVKVAVE